MNEMTIPMPTFGLFRSLRAKRRLAAALAQCLNGSE